MNRPPGPSDHWYKEHQKNCGGTFHKIKEPEKTKKTNKKQKDEKQHKITSFLTDENKKNEKDNNNNNNNIKLKKNNNNNEKKKMEKVLYTSSEDSDFEEYIKNKRKHKSIKELSEKNKKIKKIISSDDSDENSIVINEIENKKPNFDIIDIIDCDNEIMKDPYGVLEARRKRGIL